MTPGQPTTSITERILQKRVFESACEGSSYLRVKPDLVLGHEATIALLIKRLRAAEKRVFDPEKCFFAADHFVPPATPERAAILRTYLQFVDEEGIPKDQLFQGISHQLLVEDSRCVPGALIVGADSHTTMAGALGCFAAGFGSTDILAILATGLVFMTIPEAMKITFKGTLPSDVKGKDLALTMMKHLGEGGGAYRALEFVDHTDGIPMADRMTLTNMAVDCGAKNGLFAPDSITREYMRLRDKDAPGDFEEWVPGDDSAYGSHWVLDVTNLEPVVARPGSPADVAPVSEASGESVDQVFIGSCCGGRLEDLQDAAAMLRGRKVQAGLRMVVTPASQKVYKEAVLDGTVQTLIEAGAMVTTSSCGACGGIDKGILAEGEVCISTSNRNFRGRMGHPEARIYLSSARTAAAAALVGRVVDPREIEEAP